MALRVRAHLWLSPRNRRDPDDDDHQSYQLLNRDLFVQKIEGPDGDQPVCEAHEERITGREFLGGENSEPQETCDAGEQHASNQSRLTKQLQQRR